MPVVAEGETSVGFATFDMLALGLGPDSSSNFLKLLRLRTCFAKDSARFIEERP